jgi:hypothetical protein
MEWYNFIGAMAPLLAAGWTLGTLIGYWEKSELRGYSHKEKIWAWFWFEKETLMWIWIAAIACRIVLS